MDYLNNQDDIKDDIKDNNINNQNDDNKQDNNTDYIDEDGERYIDITKLVNTVEFNEKIHRNSNMHDVINETICNKHDISNNTYSLIYQPQLNGNKCKIVLVGNTNKKDNNVIIKMGTHKIFNKDMLIIGYLYIEKNLINIKNINILSLIIKELYINVTLEYCTSENIEINKEHIGNYNILINNKKIKSLDNYPGYTKAITLLIKELTQYYLNK